MFSSRRVIGKLRPRIPAAVVLPSLSSRQPRCRASLRPETTEEDPGSSSSPRRTKVNRVKIIPVWQAHPLSDNIRTPNEEAVYCSFERALEENKLHSLWVGLDRVVPREVFRRLGLREPFPSGTSAPAKPKILPPVRFAPYARQAEQDLKFLNDNKRAELQAMQRSSATRRIAAKAPEPDVPSPIVRPAVLHIEPLSAAAPQPGPSTPAPEAIKVTPARSSKSSKSRSSSKHSRKETPGETPRSSRESRSKTTPAEKGASEALAKKFRKHGISTSHDEEAVLKSPQSPYST
ncbi:hypothetical protein OUZ56_029859 [Daphnia magna]|uniref:Uncharacterized protein n=1 Tax=Daphnia magna TaxID=35525 RepID=A0ABR0B830_9CRUS|nr:hypothetical protein OUZ56_029859 [Daphnia magna]